MADDPNAHAYAITMGAFYSIATLLAEALEKTSDQPVDWQELAELAKRNLKNTVIDGLPFERQVELLDQGLQLIDVFFAHKQMHIPGPGK